MNKRAWFFFHATCLKIPPFINYLLSTYYLPDAVLGTQLQSYNNDEDFLKPDTAGASIPVEKLDRTR